VSDQFRLELFVFPDGTPVEIIVFDETGGTQGCAHDCNAADRCQTAAAVNPSAVDPDSGAPPAVTAGEGTHSCPLCGCDLVYPVEWVRREDHTWLLTLRCPNCELAREVIADREAVEHLNRWLYQSARVLAREADELGRRYFEEEAEKLVAALRGDLILPMDF
jgi:hypothetical protein